MSNQISSTLKGENHFTMKQQIKLALAVAILITGVGSAFTTQAYPPFLRKATKFGAKDCLFCHEKAEGGEGWNKRGQWLMAEKDKRKADAIDVEWLADYKEEGEKKDKP
jgi:hypothetical protein